MRRIPLIFLFSACCHASAQTQTEEIVTAYLKEHAVELKLTDGRLTGPAADWFRAEAAKARFVFVGEEHDVREIPLIAGALWRELAPLGFRHVAVEAGQWLGGRLDRFAVHGDAQALADFQTATWPRLPNNSIPPNSQEDIAFYKLLGEVSGQNAVSGTPLIWGLAYEYRATPLLKRLAHLVPTDKSLSQRVEAAEGSGDFNTASFRVEIDRLIRSFHAMPGTEAGQIADALKMRIMTPAERAQHQTSKELFLRNYRAAQRKGEPVPRVMLRFGSYHAARGLMRDSGGSTLANFVAELASAEEAKMLNILFLSCSDPPADFPRPCTSEEQVWLKPLRAASIKPWTLFDLRDLRGLIRAKRMASLQAHFDGKEYWELAMSFDAVVYLRESTRSHLP